MGGTPAHTIPALIECVDRLHKYFAIYTEDTTEMRELHSRTVAQGATAPQAAGVIHTDFEAGFIKLECCSFDDFIAHK